MDFKKGQDTYPECGHISKSARQEITEAQALALPQAKGENVLPIFEKKISDYKRMKLCSLQTNEALSCRWKRYVNNMEELHRTPFQFPISSNFHFYNYGIKYMPSMTQEYHRKQMGLGPGVDHAGQLPIPYDVSVYRSATKTKTKQSKPKESSNVKQHKVKSEQGN